MSLKNIRLAIGILGVSIVLTLFFTLGRWHDLRMVTVTFTYNLAITAAMWLGNGYITDWLSEKISWVKQPVKRLVSGVIATTLYTSLVSSLIIYSLTKIYGFQLKSDDFWRSFWLTLFITLVITVSLHARSFLLNWRQADLDRERLERAHVASQYEALRNQVNPHFLFNSLNVLTELVHQDADLAEKFINQLSKVYRYVLENRENELVSLEEEVRFIKSYLFLHEIRHADALQVDWKISNTALLLPPMALQLLVENALKHNILLPNKPLHLLIEQQQDRLIVQNNLQPKTTKEAGTGTGLEHLHKRYQYLTDKPVTIDQTSDFYRVSLPLLTSTEYAPVTSRR